MEWSGVFVFFVLNILLCCLAYNLALAFTVLCGERQCSKETEEKDLQKFSSEDFHDNTTCHGGRQNFEQLRKRSSKTKNTCKICSVATKTASQKEDNLYPQLNMQDESQPDFHTSSSVVTETARSTGGLDDRLDETMESISKIPYDASSESSIDAANLTLSSEENTEEVFCGENTNLPIPEVQTEDAFGRSSLEDSKDYFSKWDRHTF